MWPNARGRSVLTEDTHGVTRLGAEAVIWEANIGKDLRDSFKLRIPSAHKWPLGGFLCRSDRDPEKPALVFFFSSVMRDMDAAFEFNAESCFQINLDAPNGDSLVIEPARSFKENNLSLIHI